MPQVLFISSMQEALRCLAIKLMLDLVEQWILARLILFIWIILNSSNNSKKKWESKLTTKNGSHNNGLSRKSMTRRTVKSIELKQCIIRSSEIFAWVFPVDRQNMHNERKRLFTFCPCPNDSESINNLAANGFFYQDAAIECFECGRTHGNSDIDSDQVYFPTEDIQNLHAKDCPFRTGQHSARNVSISMHDQDENTQNNIIQPTANENLEDRFPGIDTSKPKHMDFAIKFNRLNSFKEWPSQVVSPETLALAGFFYTGFIDQTTCFNCGIDLYNWEIGDDPWIEHSLRSPKCIYVLRNKPPTSNGTERKMSAGDNEVTAPGILFQGHEARPEQHLDDNDRCCVCLVKKRKVEFFPCEHLVSCAECAPALTNCPICRAIIQGTKYLA